jgi:SAM-dependent methyltransferase
MGGKAHWEKIYATKSDRELSWYRDRLDASLELIGRAHLPENAAILDVGGGASTLVDDLLRIGFRDLTVLDLSAGALEQARRRLGALSESVHWIEGDVTAANLAPQRYDLWHDRAAFHFLVDAGEKNAYVIRATSAVKPGGFLILSAFALDGPGKCSGLPVQRYGAEELARQFPAFTLVESRPEQHRTPAGVLQNFTCVLMQKTQQYSRRSAEAVAGSTRSRTGL